jgi:hypothetical protein
MADLLQQQERFAWLQALIRRHFLRSFTAGVGSDVSGLPGVRQSRLAGRGRGVEHRLCTPRLEFRRDPTRPLSVLPPQFPGARQADHLPAHGRGAEPIGTLRAQAGTDQTRWPGLPSVVFGRENALPSSAACPSCLGSQYPFHQAGQERCNGYPTGCPTSGEAHRRPLLDQVDAIPISSTTRRRTLYWYRPAMRAWAIPRWVRGWSMDWAPRTRIFPASSCWSPAASSPTAASNFGARAFCPACTRACNAAPTASRCCTWKTRRSVSRPLRRRMLDAVDEINRQTYAEFGNPETVTRIAQYEMAFRMQMDATDAHGYPQGVRLHVGMPTARNPANRALPITAWWRAAWRSAACALSSSTIGDGTTTARPTPKIREPRLRRPLPRNRSAHRGAAQRSQGTRHA